MAIDLAVDIDWLMLPESVNPLVSFLCMQMSVSATHSGEQFALTLGVGGPGPYPPITWSPIPDSGAFPAGSPVPPVVFSYESSSYDSAEDELHLSSFNATMRHDVVGTLTVSGTNLTVVIDMTTYLEINFHLLGQDAAGTSANIVQRNWSVPYSVRQQPGESTLEIVPLAEATMTDNSQMIDYSVLNFLFDVPGLVDAVRNTIPQFPGELIEDIDDGIQAQLIG